MKMLVCVLSLMLCGVASAGTINLPSPEIFQYVPANRNCLNSAALAWTGAVSFSADGNYVNGISSGWLACGHSGRGSSLVYTRYCLTDVWDLSGNLVAVTVVSATASCYPAPQYPSSVTNGAGYEAYTVTNVYYGYIQSRYAVLVTP